MLPLSLLRTAQGHALLVELKNGETYNGLLVNCDPWMNINLKDAICTSRDGDKFWKISECYIRGNTIKYLCVQQEVMAKVQDEPAMPQKKGGKDGKPYFREGDRGRGGPRGSRGGRGGRGGDRGGDRGGEGYRGGGDRGGEYRGRGRGDHRGGEGRGRGGPRGRG